MANNFLPLARQQMAGLAQTTQGYFAQFMAAVATIILWTTASHADVIYFSDNFNYSNGNLAGNNGGTGWTGAWSAGTSQVANPLSGTVGKSVTISNDASVTSRQLSSPGPYTTGGSSYYLSFLFNANPFQTGGSSGDYAGISLTGGSASLFIGMPGGSGKYGFDWQGVAQPTSSASSGQNYLTLVEIKASSPTGSTVVNMYATTDLLMSGNSILTNGTLIASAQGANFSFNSVEIAGGYTSGTISLAGLAMADTANAAVNFTHAAVPEPGTLLLGTLAAALGGCGVWRNRRKKHSPLPAA